MKVPFHFLGVLLLSTLCFADYNPLENPNICGLPTCTVDENAKFKYADEKIYKYTVEVKTLFNGTSKNESSLFIEGKATLGFLTSCDGMLTLSDIKLSENVPQDGEDAIEHGNSHQFSDILSAYSLRFSFKDGIIDEVCPRDEETEWSLNFKKGILTMLQNSMKRLDLDYSLDETDVRGKCPTVYKVFGVKETTLMIEKSKDLERCDARSKLHSSIQSQAVPIFQANIHKDNILKSTSTCLMSIDHNIYKEISCQESYLLQPFSNHDQGAVTTVSQKLVLINENSVPAVDENEITRRVPLTFDNVISTKPTTNDVEQATQALKSLCQLDALADRKELANLFSKFIYSLRLLSHDGLEELQNEAGNICSTGKQFLFHALPFVNTLGSVTLMKTIITEKLASETTINEFITSIGVIPNPTSEMMEIAQSLLEESETFSANKALSVSTLAHTYCSNTKECSSDYSIYSINEYFQNHFNELIKNSPFNRETHDEIMVTLKALSNIGVMSEDFNQELFKVIENPEIDVAIRVAAVETFRRTRCEETRSYFEHIFRRQEVNSEVRIASYLQIMRCPNYLMVKTIKHALMNEEVNQVGSFVWTHLNNLMTSAKPSKVEVQSLLSDKDLAKKFDSDIRKFSRNFEGSMYFEEYSVGGNYESNVIFSTESYVPKSAMLNLTVDLFGESFNVLEIYSRVDGFEHYLESFFGPKGPSQGLKDNIMDTLRFKRDAKNNTDIKAQADQLPNVVDNFAKEPKIALGWKIFGNEAKYLTFNGKKEIQDAIDNIDPLNHLKTLLSGKEINYNKASMFLDGKYVVPTGAGLPLSLTATGTASINIKLFGSLASTGYSKDKEFELNLTADIQPTMSVDLTGEMSVDAFFASTGIKLKTNLYSDSAVKGEIKIKGAKLVSVKFSLPREKNEIFVASLGYVDTMSKKGRSQYTVKLKFETKRFRSVLYGYVLKGDTSIQGSLTNDYQFAHTKKHRVSFNFGLGDKSHKKNIEIYSAFFGILSSAYPNMNLDANATFHRSDSHKDLVFKLYQSPLPKSHPDAEDKMFKFETVASHSFLVDGRRKLRVDTSIIRKSSNLGLRGEFTYETYRSDVSSALVIQYGKNKEVSITTFWSHPRSNLEQIKTHINVTIPSFTPMILRLEVLEKQPKDFMIDFKGTWFSGHSLNAAASYQDKSGPLSSDHHVKLLLMSPSFKDITADMQFYRDNDLLKFELKGDIDRKDTYDYEIFLKHQKVSTNYTTSEVYLKYGRKSYSYSGTVYDGDYKKINANIHIDQLRDIVFSVYVNNKPYDKTLEFEMNWDSNRDASQKIMITANYKKNAAFDYTANFIITYPGRGIRGDYKFLIDGKHLNTLISFSWDVEKIFAINLDVLYEYNSKLYLEIASELKTPFDNWKVTQLKGRFEHLNNLYDLHGVVSWERRQRVDLSIFGDYTSLDKYFTCTYSVAVASSIDRVPNINTTISHMQNGTHFNTDLNLMYNPDFVIGFDSKWKIEKDNAYTNLTGTVITKTPFKAFKNGFLVSKFMIKDQKSIRGGAELILDHNHIDFNVDGKFERITNCFLIVNATSARDDYQLRLISSLAKRHFVAMVTYPSGGLGAEVLVSINSIVDFDMKLHLATPIEFLQDAVLVTKLQPEGADFRVGWNFLLLGFSGVWHYANVTDFDYSYKIYTPIEGFEENGIVGKLILKEGLDFEISIKFSYYKIGVKLLGQSKPKPLKELGIKLKNVYTRSKQAQTEEKDYDDPLSWEGLIEVDVIIYPTMKGELEIDQKGTTYIIKSQLKTPQGFIDIFDEFDFVVSILWTMNMANSELQKRKISPEDNRNAKRQTKIKDYWLSKPSTSTMNGKQKFPHLLCIHLMYFHLFCSIYFFSAKESSLYKNIFQTGVYAKYIVETRDVVPGIGAQERTYNVTLKVNTPFKALPKLNLFGALETEQNFYHAKLLFNTNRSDISVDATTEIDNGRLEFTSLFHVTTPSINIPSCELRLTKLFSEANNYVDVNVKMPQKLTSDIYSRVSWMIRSGNEFGAMVQLETPFSGLENTRAGLDVFVSDLRSTVQFMTQINPLEVEVNATLNNNVLLAYSQLGFNGDKIPITVNCSILKPSRDRRDFKGTLKLREKLFKITGNADLMGPLPSAVSVKFTPEDNSPSVTFEYRINSTTLNRYELLGSIQHSHRFTRFNANLTTTDDKHHYQIDLKMDTSNNDTFIVHGTTTFGDKKSVLNIEAETPIMKMERPKFGGTYSYDGLQRDIDGFFELTDAKGNVKANLIWLYMENMLVRVIGSFENKQYSSQSSIEGFYENPEKSFQLLKGGGDIKFDRIWESGYNITLNLPQSNYKGMETHLKLPNEHKETYSLWSNVDYKTGFRYIDYFIKYRTKYSQRKYGSSGQISTEDKQNLSGNIEVEWNGERINNFANLRRSEKTLDLIYKLKTPKFIDRQLLVTEIKYKSLGDHHNLTFEASSPEDQSVAYGTVDYKELANMNGILKLTMPRKPFNNSGASFSTKTNA
uniref:Uncharacterized protein LOC114337760 n=1 Tax=Diabrotica virgifera virgifera TaxID=50390 RepID=A0A6P7GJY7_DIAVI